MCFVYHNHGKYLATIFRLRQAGIINKDFFDIWLFDTNHTRYGCIRRIALGKCLTNNFNNTEIARKI